MARPRRNAKEKLYKFLPKQLSKRAATEIASKQEQITELLYERKVANLIVKGKSHEQVADELGISTNEAFELSKKIIRKWSGELAYTANEVREIEVKRLDALVDILTQTAFPHPIIDRNTGLPILGDDDNPIETPPDLAAVKLLLDVADRRAKLLGIDAADKMKEKAIDVMTRKYIGGSPDEL